jgi:maltose alpha-D-glucosyltransferase/alpha-amylase
VAGFRVDAVPFVIESHLPGEKPKLHFEYLTEFRKFLQWRSRDADKNMQLYGRGIRRRLAPMLGSQSRLELAYSLLFSLPGTPVLRYGDEIGMGDDLSLNEREAVRTPAVRRREGGVAAPSSGAVDQ